MKVVLLCWCYAGDLPLQCMDIGAGPHVCAVFNICLNSRRWFMLCLVYRVLSCVGAGVLRYGLTLSIGPN
jgi:hypothetical protein